MKSVDDMLDQMDSLTPPDGHGHHLFKAALLAVFMRLLCLVRQTRGKSSPAGQIVISLITAGTCGVLVSWGAREMDLAEGYTAIAVALAGYTGGELLDEARRLGLLKLRQLFGLDESSRQGLDMDDESIN